MIGSAITFYILGGLLVNLLSSDISLRWSGRLQMLLVWPWFFANERTPKMRKWLDRNKL